MTRKAGAIQFLLPENLSPEQLQLFKDSELVTLETNLYLFNVLESTERAKCLDMMEADITGEGSETRDRYIVIMGGDGSLATTINMLRTRQAIGKALAERLISFVMLPFGTGCDCA